MKRILFCAAWALLAACWPTHAAEFRGLWVDSWSPGLADASQISTLVSDARAGHFNALVVEVRRRADAFYNSNLEPKNHEVAADFDPLADLIAKAHDTSAGPRLQVHCWLVTYPAWPADKMPPPQPNHPLNLHPEWRNQTSAGAFTDGSSYYFDPGHPEVQQHIFNVVMDLVSNYDIDGINWDYIRYPGKSWGYSDPAVARFNSKYGRTGRPDSTDPLWVQFRVEQVTALVRKAYVSTMAIKPQVIFSADGFTGNPAITDAADWQTTSAYNGVMQNWLAWMQEGILDLNMPMTYFSQSTSAQAYTNWNNFIKNHRYNRHAVIGPQLGDNSISNSIVQIRMTRETTPQGNRGEGVSAYSYASHNNEKKPLATFLQALTQPSAYDPILPPVFAEVDAPPSMPWKTAPTKGHLKGFVTDDTSTALDGASIQLSGPVTKNLITDGTGFFGAVDLTPGTYTLTVSYPGCASASRQVGVAAGAVANADFSLTATGLTIVLHPQDRTALVGSSVALSTMAIGLQPLRYQWFSDQNPIPGATNSSLQLSSIQVTNAGLYKVVISNSSGSVTSLPANLVAIYPVTTSVSGNGSVALNPLLPGYAPGSSLTLAAKPGPGFMFTNWSGDISSSANPLRISISNTLSVTANFVASRYDLILDNTNASYIGAWTEATSATGRYGASYHYCTTTDGAATSVATYRPLITVAGNYDIFIWYPQGGSRATNAAWAISCEDGFFPCPVNQTTNGGKWVQIAGAKYFAAGTNGFVQLAGNSGAGRVAIADAVRFALSGAQRWVPLGFESTNWSSNGPLAATLQGNSSQRCSVEYTTNFGSWAPVQNLAFLAGSSQFTDPGSRSNAHRFYRARQIKALTLADFETNPVGNKVLFTSPRASSMTAGFIDPNAPYFTTVTNVFPRGQNRSSKVLQVSWSFIATNTSSPWLRLSTYDAPVAPNPVISFDQALGFAAYADRDLYITVGLRETSSQGAIASNGGYTGDIEWIGGVTDNTTTPPKGRFIPAGQWVWVSYRILSEPVFPFTGNGLLESTTGKGVFEEFAIVPADGLGRYNLYLDNFQFIDLYED